MPVIAVAIAAIPAIALLLAVVTRMEATFFGDGYLDDQRVRDRYLAPAAEVGAEVTQRLAVQEVR